jgi:hypothetical protein
VRRSSAGPKGGEGPRSASPPPYVAPEVGASAERHILPTFIPVKLSGMLSLEWTQKGRSPKAPARLVRVSGRDGGGSPDQTIAHRL